MTAAKTVAIVNFRIMPNDHHEEQIALIENAARRHRLEVTYFKLPPFYAAKDSGIVQAACRVTDTASPITVPFGTEAGSYQNYTQCVVLGPGNIAQAHTENEWVEIEQLGRAVDVYQRLIAELCA